MRNTRTYNVGWALLGCALLCPLSVGADVVDRIVAVIEDDIVTLRELESRAAPYLEQLEDVEDPAERAEQRKAVLLRVLDIEIGEKMVDRELAASSAMLGVNKQDVDRAIDEVLRLNKLSREQLQAALYGQGLTWGEYRKKLKSQIERARLIQFKVQGKVQITDDEVRRRCEARQSSGESGIKVCASHILLAVPEGTDEAAAEARRAEASRLQAELSSGADFAAYALQYSDDKGTPDGNLGCFGRGEMVEAFEAVAYETPVGEVSAVTKTQFGYHIIKVSERRVAASKGCSSPEELGPFRNEIYQGKMEEQMNVWIKGLREKAFVDVRL
ncbi:MAG: peptidylprolyl isomerase [Myxococcota bacterium]|nr:peptidylprolyl isomerase [Myxococcota bacterium]